MRFKRLKLSTVLLLGLGLTGLQAQKSINATGGNVKGGGGSVSYSIGQVVYATKIETTGSVTQGIQQPYEISVVTGIEDTKDMNLLISTYPNPTTDFLKLKVESKKLKDLSFQLYDLNGILLQNENLKGTETQIEMSNYIPSTYVLRILSENQSIKEFKIIKH